MPTPPNSCTTRIRLRLAQAFAVTQQLVDPAGHLQPEGGRQRWIEWVLATISALQGPARQHREPVQEDVQRPLRFIQHIAHFQDCAVSWISCVVAPKCTYSRALGLQFLCSAPSRASASAGAGYAVGDLLQVDGRKAWRPSRSPARPQANDADIGLRQRQRRLPRRASVAGGVATEDPSAHRTGVASAMGFRVNDGDCVRACRTTHGRCAAEALRMRGARGTEQSISSDSASITYPPSRTGTTGFPWKRRAPSGLSPDAPVRGLSATRSTISRGEADVTDRVEQFFERLGAETAAQPLAARAAPRGTETPCRLEAWVISWSSSWAVCCRTAPPAQHHPLR